VTLTWWVLAATGEAARNRLTQYVLASKPIVVTYNGQKQGDFPNTIIKNDLRLPYLERYLIVHVDCDQLDNESRRQLFPSTREALRDLPIGDDLRRLIIDTLGGDAPWLSREEASHVGNGERQAALHRRCPRLRPSHQRTPPAIDLLFRKIILISR
jgi:hypothetical protein